MVKKISTYIPWFYQVPPESILESPQIGSHGKNQEIEFRGLEIVVLWNIGLTLSLQWVTVFSVVLLDLQNVDHPYKFSTKNKTRNAAKSKISKGFPGPVGPTEGLRDNHTRQEKKIVLSTPKKDWITILFSQSLKF